MTDSRCQQRAETLRQKLADANHADAEQFCKGAFGPFVTDVSQYVEIVAQLLQHATDRALSAPAPSTGEPAAWQARDKVHAGIWHHCAHPHSNPDFDYRPLYAAPASGDVRAAVIEECATEAWHAMMDVCRERGFSAAKYPEWFAIIDKIRALSQAPATDTGRDLEYHSRFLLDRLQEFDPGDFEAEREFHGHVAPAIARLRRALGVA